ncbi:metalloregulator ArsR/SmtB family transcription factor [Litorilinea aerophila]|uniref:Helix-turn-helix transcriptional regulator n=1 Tax=Litorilinea aerophila TaxID=1204385 RepID=A0A540VJJ1_9CHLR|nr:metalloregulator ArsR/SmtB family transcription factor [Litorilinea aerophila]MCC9075402.1 metalloregulator ArsR/SmtB family transcription factor [Litorilinea aerophila]
MHNRHAALFNADALPADLLADVVEIFKVLSDTTRAQLIYLLTRQEYSVNELSQYVSVSPSAVSHHLAKLRATRLVRTRRAGNQIYYSIDDVHVGALFREALSHLDHVRRNLSPAGEWTEATEPPPSTTHP